MSTGLAADERALGAAFRAGDEAAVRAVYSRYSGPMYAIARGALRDAHAANDVVQQSFVQAWKAADRFDADRPLGPWLYQITRRVCVDAYRRQRRQPQLTDHGEVGHSEAAAEVVSLESTWVRWQVRQAIDDLPEPERAVVRLAHLEGLTHREVSERLGIPIGTVKSRTTRAYERLAAALRSLAPVPA